MKNHCLHECLFELPSTWVPPLGYGMVDTLETRGLGNTNEYVVTIGNFSRCSCLDFIWVNVGIL
jgi:hypothetical protein